MSGNYPDDWACYRTRCGACGGYYHTSGAEVCNCPECDECGRQEPSEALTDVADSRLCEECVEALRCQGCGEHFPHGTVLIDSRFPLRYCAACYAEYLTE